MLSQKGKYQISLDGFVYIREKVCQDKIYWRCSKNTTAIHCKGRIHTVKNTVIRSSEHNHAPFEDSPKLEKKNAKKSKKNSHK